MKTKIIYENSKNFEDDLKLAGEVILNGGLVAFPTETVYGLGANAFDPEACRKIFLAKGRPSDNPLIVHVSSLEMAEKLFFNAGEYFYKLASKFWPGPISFILKKSELISEVVSGGLDTVAIRMPNNNTSLKLINNAGVPIAAPSANISGRPSPTRSEHVIFDLGGRIDYIIASEIFPIGIESTVLDLSDEVPVILRPGAISKSMIESVLGKVEVKMFKEEKSLFNKNEKVKSPGMKYKHYSPNAKVFSLSVEMTNNDLERFAAEQGIKIGELKLISYDDDVEMAKNLFADFRQADSDGYKVILVKPAKDGELLAANLNRLNRAIEK